MARGVGGGATAAAAAVVVVGVVTAAVATEVWGPVVVSLTDDASGDALLRPEKHYCRRGSEKRHHRHHDGEDRRALPASWLGRLGNWQASGWIGGFAAGPSVSCPTGPITAPATGGPGRRQPRSGHPDARPRRSETPP